MNDSYERSYYEIALTNSQVLSALAVLLLCLLGSFVAGMWVAREAVEPQVSLAAGGETGVETATSTEAEGGEFQFFRRQGAEAEASDVPADGNGADRAQRTIAPVEVAQTPTPRSTQPRSTQPQPTESSRPEASASSTRARPEREPARRSPAPATAEPERPRVTQAVAQQPATSTTSAQLADMLVIQVLSSSDQAQADKVAEQLKSSGYRAFLSSAEVEGRTMYRVRVGPYSDQAQAEDAAQKIKRQFRLNTWITARS